MPMPSLPILLAAAALALAAFGARADSVAVAPGTDLEAVIEKLPEGSVVTLSKGVYPAPVTISKPVSILGVPGTEIRGDGMGSCILIEASGVVLKNFAITQFGGDTGRNDSGVLLRDWANGTVIEGVHFSGPGFGIRGDRLQGLTVKNCTFLGDKATHFMDRGDGIFLKYAQDVTITGSTFTHNRDSIYLENVRESRCDGNRFAGAQYGIHWMYAERGSADSNHAEAVRGGYAVMSSKKITVRNSTSDRTLEFGVLLNVADGCRIENIRVNRVHNPRGKPALDSEGKGLFVYGPGSNAVTGCTFAGSDIGIGVSMGGEGNALWNNAVVGNRTQVRYVGRKPLEWSRDGRGNYWSNYLGWDLNRDGVGDRPFQPNDSLDRLFWIYPEARFLMDSPVVALLRWLCERFEIDRGKGVTDSFPLMAPPTDSPTDKGAAIALR